MCVRASVWVGEGAVPCDWHFKHPPPPLHKITSWEDNLRACDNLFKLTFLQSVKATDQWKGSAGDQRVCASDFCPETLCRYACARAKRANSQNKTHLCFSFALVHVPPHLPTASAASFVLRRLSVCQMQHCQLHKLPQPPLHPRPFTPFHLLLLV